MADAHRTRSAGSSTGCQFVRLLQQSDRERRGESEAAEQLGLQERGDVFDAAAAQGDDVDGVGSPFGSFEHVAGKRQLVVRHGGDETPARLEGGGVEERRNGRASLVPGGVMAEVSLRSQAST